MKSVESRLTSTCDEVTELSVVTQTNKSKCDKRISDFESRYEQLSISIDSQKNKLSELYTRMSECTNQLSRISEPRNSKLAGVKSEIKLLKMNTHETNASLNGLNKSYSELTNESSTIRKRLTCVEKRMNTISFSHAVQNKDTPTQSEGPSEANHNRDVNKNTVPVTTPINRDHHNRRVQGHRTQQVPVPAADMSTQTANHRHASPAPSINNQSHPRRMRSETVTATSSTRTRHEDHPPNTDTVINSAQNRNERDMSGPSRISVITSNRNSNSVNITEPHYPDTDIAYTHDDEFIAARCNIRTRQYYIGNVDKNVNTHIISSFLQKKECLCKIHQNFTKSTHWSLLCKNKSVAQLL